eukprot:607780-Rhodomonas_salina.1
MPGTLTFKGVGQGDPREPDHHRAAQAHALLQDCSPPLRRYLRLVCGVPPLGLRVEALEGT